MTDLFDRVQTVILGSSSAYNAFLTEQTHTLDRLAGIDRTRARMLFRLVRAFSGLEENRAGTTDVAILLRQVILTYQRRLSVPLRVWNLLEPRSRDTGLHQTREVSNSTVEIMADPWEPDWLSHTESLHTLMPMRDDTRVIGDGMTFAMDKWITYRSKEQKAAVTMALFAPPGSTTLITLPTGGGKSLCASLPAWVASKGGQIRGKTTIVVVPTISLALDQERNARSFFHQTVSQDYAPHSLTSSTSTENRAIIERGIINGTLPLVFTSPESLLGRLAYVCLEAAKKGTLDRLVIDEAHIVETWGAGFRTEFQLLAAFRKKLLAASNGDLRTILLSATISPQSEDVLQTLFAPQQASNWIRVQADQLRPEIQYWMHTAETEEERQRQVLEALCHLPRPAILYVTSPEDAQTWFTYLQGYGFERMAMYTGQTASDERIRLIKEWDHDQRDLMIATSAFGLGIDKPDVRTIIHACIPESIARFYQEVGRAGRDGCQAISLSCVVRDTDQAKAWNLIKSKRITAERAVVRWRGMQKSKYSQFMSGQQVLIDLDAIPLEEQEKDSSALNQNWNEHILLLMQRSHIIEITDVPQDTHHDEGATRTVMVNIKRHDVVNDEQTFIDLFTKARNNELDDIKRDLNRLLHIIHILSSPHPEHCITKPLRSTYPESALACGGCPACRYQNLPPFANHPTLSIERDRSSPSSTTLSKPLEAIMGQYQSVTIFIQSSLTSDRMHDLEDVLILLVSHGMSQILIPGAVLDEDTIYSLVHRLAQKCDTPHSLLLTEWLDNNYPLLAYPTIIIYPSEDTDIDHLYQQTRSLIDRVPTIHIIRSSAYLASEHGMFKDRINGPPHTLISIQHELDPVAHDTFLDNLY